MAKYIVAAVLAALLATGVGAGVASAHASLLRCSIKNNQVLKAGHTPSTVTAFFAEELDSNANHSWMAVFEGAGDHGLVTEKQHSVVNFKNPKEMTLKLPRLTRGPYYLIWYTRSAIDGHYAAGIVYFKVR